MPSAGLSYSQESIPSANMFFARSASFLVISKSSRALTVIEVIGTACTLYCSSESVLERAALVADLGQVPLGELVGVDDQVAAPRQVLEVGFQGGGVHRDEHVRRVTRREDVVVGELQLETRYAGEGASRGPDFRREIRHSGQVVTEDRRLLGEPVSRELHAVTRVTGEPDDDVIELLDLLGHSWKTSSARRGRALTWHHPTAWGIS